MADISFVCFLCLDRRHRRFFCLIFEMSHHFDGTSFSSVLNVISHVKRVQNWHAHSHQFDKTHSSHCPHAHNLYIIIFVATFFSSVRFPKCWHVFHSLRRCSALWCNSKSPTSTVSNKMETKRIILCIKNVDGESVKYRISRWHWVETCQKYNVE